MSPNRTHQFFESFPHLFRRKNKPLTESRISEGFICEDGWLELVRDLSQTIDAIARADGRESGSGQWQEVIQVKEKLPLYSGRCSSNRAASLGSVPAALVWCVVI
ncbi:MAG TPA: hypothetical protein VJ654_17900 [Noviherbaspirillum sp.]|nr:hypothetical protein [Noviherbaspirillum sp.]